jgi:hypothetical protein
MQPLRDISDNNTSSAGFKGDSAGVEPAVISDVPAMRKADQAFAGTDPDDSVNASHMENITTASIPKLSPVVFFPARPVRQDTFVSLQRWEGFVVRLTEDAFVARLIDMSGKTPVEEAEFPLTLPDVSEDKDLIQPGAVFYWNIDHSIPKVTRLEHCGDWFGPRGGGEAQR